MDKFVLLSVSLFCYGCVFCYRYVCFVIDLCVLLSVSFFVIGKFVLLSVSLFCYR